MSTFITSLWDSIFTPGPTAPLLYATNLSFAALQLVLLGLLFATKSIHCVVLSGLCAGLWGAINWFAGEVKIVQERQRREEMLRGEREEETRKGRGDGDGDGEGEGDISDAEGTEVENLTGREGEGEGGQMGSELRRREAGLSQSSASTEDEWEKVSGK
ncbi:related to PKR1 protein [Claviceps purpurea 20.1]|uniref:Related to PKR1 protein n=1 Tax=Claviceps purpurea (strain 20.1) TaxID=1111077 RepID=M1W319_CLAP2|nr:related to PKR1 protein [Claviceps purpurea 20.1]